MRVKAMQLWSEWNSDLLTWEREHNSPSEPSLDYFVLRLEDLLDEETRFLQIKRVAEFVGSQMTNEQLCCVALERTEDMGTHSKDSHNKDVKARYGKWREPLERDPQLSEKLHREGSIGLASFGYEPWRDWMEPDTSGGGFVCSRATTKGC